MHERKNLEFNHAFYHLVFFKNRFGNDCSIFNYCFVAIQKLMLKIYRLFEREFRACAASESNHPHLTL